MRSSDIERDSSVQDIVKENHRYSFSNEKPLLLISKHSVDQLNSNLRHLNQPLVSAKHFRPNLVVECVGKDNETNAVHHLEDSWKTVSIRLDDKNSGSSSDNSDTDIQLAACGLCARCAMVDFDPNSGTKGKTLRALAEYRRGNNGEIYFGIFLKAKSLPHIQDEVVQSEHQTPREVVLEEGCSLLCA